MLSVSQVLASKILENTVPVSAPDRPAGLKMSSLAVKVTVTF